MRIRDLPRDPLVWLFAAIALALFFEPLTTGTFYFRDLYHLFYPKRLILAEALRSGAIPSWDVMTHSGQPFLATPSNLGLHPSNALYAVLPPLTAFNVVLVLHFWVAAVTAYWLARVVAISRGGAFVAGIAFAFCGLTLSSANLMPLLFALPWIPLTIGLAHRAVRGEQSVLAAAIAATMPLYCAAVELTGMMFVTLLVWLAFTSREVRWRRKATLFLTIALFAAGLSLAQTLPATSVIAQSSRGEKRSYEGFTQWSVRPERFPELIVPRFLGRTDSIDEANYWGAELEDRGFPYMLSIYVGAPLLLLAFAGAASSLPANRAPRRALALISLVALALSLGRFLPGFRFIYDQLPLVTTFRFPVKAQFAAILPLAILAASGVDAILVSRRARRWTAAGAAAIALAASACAFLLLQPSFARAFERAFSFTALGPGQLALLRGSFTHVVLGSFALVLALIAAEGGTRKAAVAVAAIVAIDLVTAGWSVNSYAPRAIFDEPPPVAAIRAERGTGRFHASESKIVLRAPSDSTMWLAKHQLDTLDGYTASLFGIPVVFHADYDGLAPARMARLSRVVDRLPWPQRRLLFDRANVSVFSSRDLLQAPGLRVLGQVSTPTGPLRFYRNERAAAARFVSEIEAAGDDGDAFARLLRSTDSTRAIASSDRVPAVPCGTASVNQISASPGAARYELDAPCEGVVVFAENFYRGWQTRIDGVPTEEFAADYAFAAVRVAKGHHVITRRYATPLIGAGVAGTLTSLVLLIAIAVVQRARARRVDSMAV